MEITDIHCHVLPGIDDGARTEEESLQMLKMAYGQGIRRVFATSHGSLEFLSSRPDIILQRCRELEQRARAEKEESKDGGAPEKKVVYNNNTAAKMSVNGNEKPVDKFKRAERYPRGSAV